MRPASFTYFRAESVEEALGLLGEHGPDAKLIAGGQSLVPLMNMRLARPATLVDIWGISSLRFIESNRESLVVGATVRHQDFIRRGSHQISPIFRRVASHIGHLPVRNRGTIGGSLAHADPVAEWCLLAVALDAVVEATSSSGARWIPAGELFEGPFTTTLEDGEIITRIRFPQPPLSTCFTEYAVRQGDFALAAAVASFESGDNGRIRARVAVAGGGSSPTRLPEIESILSVDDAVDPVLDRVEEVARRTVSPSDDVHASAEYRRHLSGVLVRRAVEGAWKRHVESQGPV